MKIDFDDIDYEEFDNSQKYMIVEHIYDNNSLYVIRFNDYLIDNNGDLLEMVDMEVFNEYYVTNDKLFRRIKSDDRIQKIKDIKDDKLYIYIYNNGKDYDIDYDNSDKTTRFWYKTNYSDLIKKLNLIF